MQFEIGLYRSVKINRQFQMVQNDIIMILVVLVAAVVFAWHTHACNLAVFSCNIVENSQFDKFSTERSMIVCKLPAKNKR